MSALLDQHPAEAGQRSAGTRGSVEQVQNAVNSECVQLLRLVWNVHEDCHLLLHRLRLMLTQARRMSQHSFQHHIRPHQLQLLGQQVKWTCDNVTSALAQFLALSQFQSHCKLILFSKMRQAKEVLSQDRVSILFHTSALIDACADLLLGGDDVETAGGGKEDEAGQTSAGPAWAGAQLLQLAQHYNSCLESVWRWPVQVSFILSKPSALGLVNGQGLQGPREKSKMQELLNGVKIVCQVDCANNNDSPLLRLSLKAQSGTRLLEALAKRMAVAHCSPFGDLLQHIWFSSDLPASHADDLLNGAKAKIESESRKAVSALSKLTSLLPRVKGQMERDSKEREEEMRTKLRQYFDQVLWTLVGDCCSDALLWQGQSSLLPVVLRPTEQVLRLCARFGAQPSQTGNSPEGADARSTFHSVTQTIHSFSQLCLWDWNMLMGGACAYKIKRPEQVVLSSPALTQDWSSDIGRRFGDIAVSCLESLQPIGTHTSLETCLCDQAAILFRLDATLAYFNCWMVRRAKAWLNAWSIPQFVACSQRDSSLLVSSVQSNQSLLVTGPVLLQNPNTLIRLSALLRQMCSEDLQATLKKLTVMPEELVGAVGPVAQTLSLATLQSYMPPASHWRRVGPASGLDPAKPSPYVRLFIERVLEPVVSAVVEFVRGPVQEAIGKQVVQAACEAWLEFILEKQIHFSEWGAVQLLRDFMSIREWIRNETQLDAEARKNVLQLEILKRCEGVAYLLLRSPGDVLGVGKPSRKNRRVVPSDSTESSPSASVVSITEDDIPPEMYVPNQQMWLDLRLRPSFLSSCCE